MAVAADLSATPRNVIAVIGDGALSAGMAYEALNNAGALDARLIVILNDNDMSIAPPTGAMSAYLARLASGRTYMGFDGYAPDVCLINRYEVGTRLTLHRDHDERDRRAPIVSVSLGLPAIFLFGGMKRTDKPQRYRLEHGDVVVWGGADRLRFHGVLPVKPGHHPVVGGQRLNLTFRKVR